MRNMRVAIKGVLSRRVENTLAQGISNQSMLFIAINQHFHAVTNRQLQQLLLNSSIFRHNVKIEC